MNTIGTDKHLAASRTDFTSTQREVSCSPGRLEQTDVHSSHYLTANGAVVCPGVLFRRFDRDREVTFTTIGVRPDFNNQDITRSDRQPFNQRVINFARN